MVVIGDFSGTVSVFNPITFESLSSHFFDGASIRYLCFHDKIANLLFIGTTAGTVWAWYCGFSEPSIICSLNQTVTSIRIKRHRVDGGQGDLDFLIVGTTKGQLSLFQLENYDNVTA